jgi:hypothetical protein
MLFSTSTKISSGHEWQEFGYEELTTASLSEVIF